MADPRTCGQGLAEHSELPAKLAGLIGAMAETLETHMKALDPSDESARQEQRAYRRLSTEMERIADELDAVATEMARYRDLPMGRHDEKTMSAEPARRAFEGFVTREQELLALLQKDVVSHRAMLGEM